MNLPSKGEPVAVDSCVLAVFAAADLLLRIAECSTHFTPKWSDQILDEMTRAHRKFGWDEAGAKSFRACLAPAFPQACVQGYEPLIAQCTNAANDRHVLACAIQAKVKTILTFNLRDFKDKDCAPWVVRAIHPQDYLLALYGKDSEAVWEALEAQADKQGETVEERLLTLHRHVPKFADALLAALP